MQPKQQPSRELTAKAYAEQLSARTSTPSSDSTLDIIFVKPLQTELKRLESLTPEEIISENLSNFMQKVAVLEKYKDKLPAHGVCIKFLKEVRAIENSESEDHAYLKWEIHLARECAEIEDINEQLLALVINKKPISFELNLFTEVLGAINNFREDIAHETGLHSSANKLKSLNAHLHAAEKLLNQYAEFHLKIILNRIAPALEVLRTMLHRSAINRDSLEMANTNVKLVKKLIDELFALEVFINNPSTKQSIFDKIEEAHKIVGLSQDKFRVQAPVSPMTPSKTLRHSHDTKTSTNRKSLKDDDETSL